jgi:acetylornithine aminotransferase
MQNTFSFPGRAMLLPNIIRAENCTLFDSKGNQYLDMESGVWCTSIGHANPAVREAIIRQMDNIAHVGFCYTTPVVEQSAKVVLKLLAHEGGRCTFLCSGSEAVEYGVRVVRSVSQSKKIMTLSDSYFGAYGDADSKNPDSWFIFDWSECEKCELETCTNACPLFSSIPFDKIGAFLFEPGSFSGQVRFPPVKLINHITRDISAMNGFVMVNEVTTGIGRTGKWFGFQHYQMQPDIVAVGKGIGNGYPVSATSVNSRIANLLDCEPIPYSQSHLNDPLGAAVAKAVITTIYENDLIERALAISTILLPGLQRIASQSRLIECVRGRGLMAVLVVADHYDSSIASELHRQLLEKGIIVDHRQETHILRIHPALTVAEQDVLRFLAILEEILGAMGS